MTSQTCRDVINIIGRFVPPLRAQIILEKYCKGIELSLNDFSEDDVPKFILYLASQRDDVNNLDDNHFFTMLRNLVFFSNSKNEFVNKEDIKRIIADNREAS